VVRPLLNSLLDRPPACVRHEPVIPVLPVRIWLLGVRNDRQPGNFLIGAVGERKTLSTLALEDGVFRAPGGQRTEEDYPLSALFANRITLLERPTTRTPLRSFL
jgi:hypothetical protein